MPYAYDRQIGLALQAIYAQRDGAVAPAAGDWRSLRAGLDTQMAMLGRAAPALANVTTTQHSTIADDGSEIALRWYGRTGSSPGSAALYIHGGGMICGSVDLYDPIVSAYVAASGVPILSVEYRLAPEHPHPAPVEDSYAGLRWLAAHAAELGVDPARLGVMGDSAGGGLAAGVALLARDRGLRLARQILIYPMLDDRTVTADAELAPLATWTYDNNSTGWRALLGAAAGTSLVPAAAAPARADDLAGLAPAYIEVGDLDILAGEAIRYAGRLAASHIPVELHVHPGAPHGYERIAPGSDLAVRSAADRIRALAGL